MEDPLGDRGQELLLFYPTCGTLFQESPGKCSLHGMLGNVVHLGCLCLQGEESLCAPAFL